MSTITSSWREFATALSATLITAAAGTTVGWTSPTLPVLLGPSSPIPTTPDQSSWIASIMILSSAVSPVVAAFLADLIGRKATLLLAAAPYIIGWVLIIEADSVAMIYVSRIISGIGYGLVYTTAPMYLGEIASDKVRGTMATLITVMSKAGILVQYCVGPYVSFSALAGINLIFPLAFLLIFIWVPESPYFYLKVDRRDKAEKALNKLRGSNNVHQELEYMDRLVTEDMKHHGKWKDLMTIEGNRRALIIIIIIYTTQQFCGSTAVIAYAQQIFSKTKLELDAAKSCIILGCVQLITSAVSSSLVDRLGRKPLLLVSSAGVGIGNTAVGTYFLLQFLDFDTSYINWIPITAIVIFICSYTIGLATVPFAITSEMFPTNIKSRATCVIQTYTAVSTFAVTKLYQVIADNIGIYVTFFGFAFFSFAGFIFVYMFLPETKGQSFAFIQDQLKVRRQIIEKSDPLQEEE